VALPLIESKRRGWLRLSNKTIHEIFPDINVWLALAYEGHQPHESATAWFSKLNGETVYF
jgi:hypothetical protein